MDAYQIIKDNWLTRAPHKDAFERAAAFCLVVLSAALLYFTGALHAATWMPASAKSVLQQHEYWRLWTTLFAHSDPAHLLSNALLFVPFCYWLVAYFGWFLLAGFFVGGLINALVLWTLPEATLLIGLSGVVYWMGAAWLTLFFLIDRRESVKRRLAKVLIASLIIFFPQTFQPNVSYLSHFLGFLTGLASALLYYRLRRKSFADAEVREWVFDEDWDDEEPEQSVSH